MGRARRQSFGPGDVFAVPLAGQGWAVGCLARWKEGVGVGYFYGPRLTELAQPVPPLQPERTRWITRFDDTALAAGRWPVIGRVTAWDRWQWPIPDLGRFDLVINMAWRVRYADTDPGRIVQERRITWAEYTLLPRDGLPVPGTVEEIVARLLASPFEDVPGGTIASIRAVPWFQTVVGAQRTARLTAPSLSVRDETANSGPDEQAVIIRVPVGQGRFVSRRVRRSLKSLEDEVTRVIERSGIGTVDGTEAGAGEASVFVRGPQADELFMVIRPVLDAFRLPAGSYVLKRYGRPTDGPGIRIDL